MSVAPPRERVGIGRLGVDPMTFSEALDAIVELVERGDGGTVLTPNVDHVVQAESLPELRAAYEDASLSLVDGMPLLWAARLLGRPLPQKISGSDLFLPLVARAADRGMSVYLLGAAPGVAEACAAKLQDRFPPLGAVETHSPVVDHDLDSPTREAIVSRLRAARPDIVFVALGCPKQEVLMRRIARDVRPAVLVGVGASLDFVVGTLRRAPRWMSAAGLEWLHRLVREPVRLAPRYLVRDPRFVGIVLSQLRRGASGHASRRARALSPVPDRPRRGPG